MSNNTVCKRIDGMSRDVERQLAEKLRNRELVLKIDESALGYSESFITSYIRFIEDGKFVKECFCVKLEGTVTPNNILIL